MNGIPHATDTRVANLLNKANIKTPEQLIEYHTEKGKVPRIGKKIWDDMVAACGGSSSERSLPGTMNHSWYEKTTYVLVDGMCMSGTIDALLIEPSRISVLVKYYHVKKGKNRKKLVHPLAIVAAEHMWLLKEIQSESDAPECDLLTSQLPALKIHEDKRFLSAEDWARFDWIADDVNALLAHSIFDDPDVDPYSIHLTAHG